MSVAFDEMVTVRVCLKCGRGFPEWTPSIAVDGYAVWWTQSETGPRCGGAVISVGRRGQIEHVLDEEFFTGEQWTPEQVATLKKREPGDAES